MKRNIPAFLRLAQSISGRAVRLATLQARGLDQLEMCSITHDSWKVFPTSGTRIPVYKALQTRDISACHVRNPVTSSLMTVDRH